MFYVGSGIPAQLRLATFFYPSWKASVNGSDVTPTIDEGGALVVPLPADEVRVRVRFEEPPHHAVARIVSAASWIVLLVAVAFAIAKNLRFRSLLCV